MKSELRTELKSNLLADRLEEVVLAIKPHLKLIGFSLAAIIVAAVIYGVVQSRSEKKSAEAWSELYFSANRTDKLEEVYQDFPTTTAGLWARQKSADALTSRALNQVYIDRDLSDKLLEEAREGYRAVLEKAREPMLVCRATYGLAQVLDSEGNASEAAREFKKLLTLPGAHSEMIADAQRRLEFIESDEGRAFFEWYKNNRPTAPKPVDIPGNLGALPSQPDLQFSTPSVPMIPSSAAEATNIADPSSGPTSPALELLPVENAPIVTPPTEKSLSESAPKPPTLKAPIAEPSIEEPKADDQELKLPDPEPAAPEKQSGSS